MRVFYQVSYYYFLLLIFLLNVIYSYQIPLQNRQIDDLKNQNKIFVTEFKEYYKTSKNLKLEIEKYFYSLNDSKPWN